MPDRLSAAMIEALGSIAPGRPLREGLDRILQANMGALIVVGDGPEVLSICSGGFLLDAEFSPQRLSELAKMDGAIILASDASRIARANVHLVPSPAVATSETGTRHRTAERVARSIDVPVITVSEDRSVISVYRGEQQRPLVPVERLLARANQALETLEGYRDRLNVVTNALSALEVEDMVTVRDVVTVLQRTEMVRRIAEEVDGYSIELGTDSRLVRLQLEEMLAGVEEERRQIMRDYLPPDPAWGVGEGLSALGHLTTDRLLDLSRVASVLRIGGPGADLESPLRPYGYRLLAKIPRLPEHVVRNIVERYGGLQQILRASAEDLDKVEGIEVAGAHFVKEGLARLAETSILDRLG
ncbi:MAG TPA: DNA integrity scanning diadenylate cyclase DisA [Acidimicrobiales bacterium]|nr:DNA integrity scanning diadenylate cyclase DisA [Acidimicrobiales bacterium]